MEDEPTPHSITLGLGAEREIRGLWVRPQFGKTNAIITGYCVEESRDGKTFWPVWEGRWPATASTKAVTWDGAVRGVRSSRHDWAFERPGVCGGHKGHCGAVETNVTAHKRTNLDGTLH